VVNYCISRLVSCKYFTWLWDLFNEAHAVFFNVLLSTSLNHLSSCIKVHSSRVWISDIWTVDACLKFGHSNVMCYWRISEVYNVECIDLSDYMMHSTSTTSCNVTRKTGLVCAQELKSNVQYLSLYISCWYLACVGVGNCKM